MNPPCLSTSVEIAGGVSFLGNLWISQRGLKMIECLLPSKVCSLQNSQRLTYENIYLTNQYRGVSGIVSNSPSPGHQHNPLSGVVKGVLYAWVLFRALSPFIILFCIISDPQCPRMLCLPFEPSILVMIWISESWQFSLSRLQLFRVHTFKVSSLAVFLQYIQLLFQICSHRADRSRAGI